MRNRYGRLRSLENENLCHSVVDDTGDGSHATIYRATDSNIPSAHKNMQVSTRNRKETDSRIIRSLSMVSERSISPERRRIQNLRKIITKLFKHCSGRNQYLEAHLLKTVSVSYIFEDAVRNDLGSYLIHRTLQQIMGGQFSLNKKETQILTMKTSISDRSEKRNLLAVVSRFPGNRYRKFKSLGRDIGNDEAKKALHDSDDTKLSSAFVTDIVREVEVTPQLNSSLLNENRSVDHLGDTGIEDMIIDSEQNDIAVRAHVTLGGPDCQERESCSTSYHSKLIHPENVNQGEAATSLVCERTEFHDMASVKYVLSEEQRRNITLGDMSDSLTRLSLEGTKQNVALDNFSDDPTKLCDTYHPPQNCNVFIVLIDFSPEPPSELNSIPWNDLERKTLREATFALCPHGEGGIANFLSESGFLYCGDGINDDIMCFYCLIGLQNWQSAADIQSLHRHFRPNCPMVAISSSSGMELENLSGNKTRTIGDSRPLNGRENAREYVTQNQDEGIPQAAARPIWRDPSEVPQVNYSMTQFMEGYPEPQSRTPSSLSRGQISGDWSQAASTVRNESNMELDIVEQYGASNVVNTEAMVNTSTAHSRDDRSVVGVSTYAQPVFHSASGGLIRGQSNSNFPNGNTMPSDSLYHLTTRGPSSNSLTARGPSSNSLTAHAPSISSPTEHVPMQIQDPSSTPDAFVSQLTGSDRPRSHNGDLRPAGKSITGRIRHNHHLTSTTPEDQAGQAQPSGATNITDDSAETSESAINTHPILHPIINSVVYAIPTQPQSSTTTSTTTAVAAASGSSSTSTTSSVSDQVRGLNCQELGIFIDKPRDPGYAVLFSRIRTFEDWPEDNPVSREDIARAGFYYRGYADSCKCYFCGGGLGSWEPNDNAFIEHARWFPKCMFLRQAMGQEFVDVVQELHRARERNIPILYDEVERLMRRPIVNEFEESQPVENDAAVRAVIGSGYVEEQVVDVAQQLRRDGEMLSSDAIVQKLTEGRGAVGGPDRNTENEGNQGDNASSSNRSRELEQLRSQNYRLRSNLLCKICMDKEIRMVFLPCGHLISCQECAVAVQDCPMCRRHIRGTVKATLRN